MTDAISRSAVLADVESIDWYHVNRDGKLVSGSTSYDVSYVKFDDVVHMLKNASALDVEPVIRARWEDTTPMWLTKGQKLPTCRLVCTNCGRRTSHRKARSYKRCPNCGARMDGEENAAY